MNRQLLLFSLASILSLAACSADPAEWSPVTGDAEQTEPVSLPENRFLTIAHRGASAYRPEHTLPAYILADEMGADYLELDLRMTKDGRLAVIHDDELQRVTGTPGKVSDMTMDELKTVSAGAVFNEENPSLADESYENLGVPELKDVLLRFGTTANYYIELKAPPRDGRMEEDVINELERYGITENAGQDRLPPVILQSFSEESLMRLHELRPEIPLIGLYSLKGNADLSPGAIQKLRSYASGIGIPAASAHAGFIEKMQGWGLDVHIFTVNEEQDMQKFIDMGADGIFTDKPDLARRVDTRN